MATTYGYVIYEFEVCEGQKRTPINLATAGDYHFYDVLLENLTQLRDRGTLGEIRSVPDGDDDEDEDTGPAQPRLTRVETVHERGWTIAFRARYGRVGSHDLAMTEAGDDIDLQDHAPSRPYRGLFVVPPTGEKGLVAIEVIGRTQPLEKVVRWLKQVSDVPWRIRLARSKDEHAFLATLEANRDMYIELEKQQPGEDDTPGGRRMKVYAPLTTRPQRSKVRETVLGWVERRDNHQIAPAPGAPVDSGAEARALAVIAEPEMRDVSFEDAKVVTKDEDGMNRVFRPDLRFNLFTYFLGDQRPDNDTFYSKARASMAKQFTATDMTMPDDWATTRD